MSRIICHENCPSGGHGPRVGLVIAIAVLVGVVAAVRAAARPLEHAADVVLEAAVIAAASVAGLAALAVVAYVARRAHGRQAIDRQTTANMPQ